MEPKGFFLQVPGARLHYMDWGDNGPPLVLLHGGRLTSRCWDATARLLYADFHVIALDARGQGDSERTERGYSYKQRVADLNAFLDVMRLEHPFGAGHSAGAITMSLHGADFPGRFARLVLIETPALPFGHQAGAAARPQGEHRRRGSAEQRRIWPSRSDMEAYLRQHPVTGLWREDVLLDVVRNSAGELSDGRVEMKWVPEAYSPSETAPNTRGLSEVAQDIIVPTLLVYGTRGIASEDQYLACAKAVAQSSLVVVEGAGHNIHMEDPDLAAALVRGFMLAPEPPAHEETRVGMHAGRVLGSGIRTG